MPRIASLECQRTPHSAGERPGTCDLRFLPHGRSGTRPQSVSPPKLALFNYNDLPHPSHALVTCCSASNSKTFAHSQDWSQRAQMYCLDCGGAFHHAVGTAADPQAISAVACLERLLRAGLSGNRLVNLNGKTLSTESLFLFVEDMAWALMLLVASSPYRALHSLRTPAFPVPMGFNTPVESNKWLCCGPLPIRRSIFGVLASPPPPPTPCGTLTPESGTGRRFAIRRALQSPGQRRAFRARTDCRTPSF